MTNILITGVSRTGKSTLAKSLYKLLNDTTHNYSLMPFDPFIDAWKSKMMENDHSLEKWKELEFSHTCREMIAYTINKLSKKQYENEFFIFESAHAIYDPKHFGKLLEDYQIKDLIVIHLLHDPSYSPEKLLQLVRINDNESDWTFYKDTEELMYKFDCGLHENSAAYQYFLDFNQPYYVTSENRMAVFHKILNEIRLAIHSTQNQ